MPYISSYPAFASSDSVQLLSGISLVNEAFSSSMLNITNKCVLYLIHSMHDQLKIIPVYPLPGYSPAIYIWRVKLPWRICSYWRKHCIVLFFSHKTLIEYASVCRDYFNEQLWPLPQGNLAPLIMLVLCLDSSGSFYTIPVPPNNYILLAGGRPARIPSEAVLRNFVPLQLWSLLVICEGLCLSGISRRI